LDDTLDCVYSSLVALVKVEQNSLIGITLDLIDILFLSLESSGMEKLASYL